MSTIQLLNPARIVPSPTNPRKHFNEAALAELTESVKTHGVLQPVLARQKPRDFECEPVKGVSLPGDGNRVWSVVEVEINDRTNRHTVLFNLTKQDAARRAKEANEATHELIAGERRWRAATAAQLAEIPVIVLEVDDRTALELQVIENAQRADLHPMEEAEGYARLVNDHGYTVEELSIKVGKSKASVYARLKLTELCLAAREALWGDTISHSVALLIARIPHAELQEKALNEITTHWNGSMSFRDAARMIQRDYMQALDAAPFDPKDAKLLPEAGPCTKCPKRTGNQPELFADIDSKDVCTDPECFRAKREAEAQRRLETAKAEGARVLEPEETKKVLSYGSARQDSGLIALDSWCDCAVQPDPEEPGIGEDGEDDNYSETDEDWRALLGDVPLADRVIAVDDNGQVIEMMDRDKAIELLRARGKLDEEALGRRDAGGRDYEAENRKRLEKQKLLNEVAQRATTEILSELLEVDSKGRVSFKPAVWTMLARQARLHCHIDAEHFVATRRKLSSKQTETRDKLAAYIDEQCANSPHLCAELICELLLCASPVEGWDPEFGAHFTEVAEFAGVDLKAITKAVKAEAKPKKKAAKKKAKTLPASDADDTNVIDPEVVTGKKRKAKA